MRPRTAPDQRVQGRILAHPPMTFIYNILRYVWGPVGERRLFCPQYVRNSDVRKVSSRSIKARTAGGANRSAACLSQLGGRLAHEEAGTLGGLSDCVALV